MVIKYGKEYGKEYAMEAHDITNAFDRFKSIYVDSLAVQNSCRSIDNEDIQRSLTASEIRLKQMEIDIEAKIDTNRFRESLANYVKVLNNSQPDNSNFDDFLSKEEMEIK